MRATKYTLVFFTILIIFHCKTKPIVTVPGGWINQEINAPIVIKSFDFLKKEAKLNFKNIEILEVLTAKTQVVAGTNVALNCKYKLKEKKASNLNAIINIDLEKKYTLIKFDFTAPKGLVAP